MTSIYLGDYLPRKGERERQKQNYADVHFLA